VAQGLVALPDWQARLAATAAHFPDEKHRDYHALCVDAVKKRCISLMRHTWPEGSKVKCPVTLIRTKIRLGGADEDYGLAEVSTYKFSTLFVPVE
jgi:hypothetical protein